jgi:hypothetical protein
MNWINLIKPEMLVLMPVLYIIGNLIKSSPAKNWMIPFILWGISVVITVAYIFATEDIDAIHFFIGFVQGTLLTFATVGTNEVIKQAAISKAIVGKEDETDGAKEEGAADGKRATDGGKSDTTGGEKENAAGDGDDKDAGADSADKGEAADGGKKKSHNLK